MLSAACLIVFGTRLQEGPILVTAVGEPSGSVADSYVEVRHRVEGAEAQTMVGGGVPNR